jgi:hypothetical protein
MMTGSRKSKSEEAGWRAAYLEGVRTLVSSKIWHHVNDAWHPDCRTQEELAERLRVDTATVSRGLSETKGELSLACLIHMLVRSQKRWSDLPSLPGRPERAAAGIDHVVTERLKFSPAQYHCLRAMEWDLHKWMTFRSVYEEYPIARREDEWRSRELSNLPEQIADRAEGSLGHVASLDGCTVRDRPAWINALIKLDHEKSGEYERFRQWLEENDWGED